MTLKGGTSQACAACKYQRRRCLPECQLAPYFPADDPQKFTNAHRLFGVSNILKILKQLDPSHRDEAMRSIVYQSDVRAKFPVLGCYGYIHQLVSAIQAMQMELDWVRSQIAVYKMQKGQGSEGPSNLTLDNDESNSLLQLGMGPPSGGSLGILGADLVGQSGGFGYGDGGGQFWGQQGGVGTESCTVNGSYGVGHNIDLMEALQLSDQDQQQHQSVGPQGVVDMKQDSDNLVHGYEAMNPFLDAVDDDQQSFVDSKPPMDSFMDSKPHQDLRQSLIEMAYESNSLDSDESSAMKDTMRAMEYHHQVESSDLKNAAAYFRLANVN